MVVARYRSWVAHAGSSTSKTSVPLTSVDGRQWAATAGPTASSQRENTADSDAELGAPSRVARSSSEARTGRGSPWSDWPEPTARSGRHVVTGPPLPPRDRSDGPSRDDPAAADAH